MFVSVDRKTIRVEGTEQEEKELHNRMRRALYILEKKEQQRQREIEQRGYCQDCYIILTIAHKCPKCGTTWSFHTGGMVSR